MIKILRYAILLTLSLSLNAQIDFKPEDFKSMKFRNIGPAGMSGRITAIDVDLSSPARIFAGSASGGVWLSENGGTSWKPVFDEQSSLAIGAIKINQKNPSEIWVGTGEGNPRNSLNTGNGIYKSLDGGKTWKCMGLENTKTIHRIIVHRDDPNIVFVAAMGSPWGPNEERGVFKTTDGGKTWQKILYVNPLTGAADLVTDPTNPNKLLVSMWEHQREPWFFNSGGKGSGLYITYDAGENWKKIAAEDGLPKGDLGRIGVAIAPSRPNIIYALVEAKENGLYKSNDGGKKWSLVSTKNIGDRPFYYAELYVDPLNENRIYNIYTYVSMSEDGGKSFRSIADYGNSVHPDHHAFWIHPTDPEFIIDGNDGGLTISRDRGETWQFAGNIPVGQFYHVNVDHDFPYNVYGGMQDNGSWAGPSSVLKSGGIRNNDFQELYFGDGFDVVPFPSDSRYGYAMSQGGNVGFYDRMTGKTRFIKPIHPDTSITLRYNWNAAIAQDPFKDCGVYFGSQYVHYSSDCGESWTVISPDLTTNNPEKQKADKSGGLTPDATNAENHTTILAIAPSPADRNVIWAGTDDGNVQISRDGGKTWKNVASKLKGLPDNSWVPQIVTSATMAGEAFVVANNYRRNDYNPYAYFTDDFGASWKRIADAGQIKGFVISVVQDPVVPELLFLGTDVGLYVSFDKGQNWVHWTKNLPQVQISDMKIHPFYNDLIISTFGRALWILDEITPLRNIASGKGELLKKDMALTGESSGWLVSNKSYDGIRFTGQGEFIGDNKSWNNVAQGLWIKPSENQKEDSGTKEESKEKIKVTILDEKGQKIRFFTQKPESGFQRIYWNLTRDGVRYPTRRSRNDNDNTLPSGTRVFPGKYKMVCEYKKQKDSVWVNVNADPRTKYDSTQQIKINNYLNELDQLVTEATKAFNTIQDARSGIQIVDKILEQQEDTISKSFKTWHKKLNKQLDSLENMFIDPEQQKGIQRDPDNVNSALFGARSYLSSSWSAPGENALISLDHARKAVDEALQKVGNFKEKEWLPYVEKAESLQVKVLKIKKE